MIPSKRIAEINQQMPQWQAVDMDFFLEPFYTLGSLIISALILVRLLPNACLVLLRVFALLR